MSSQRIARLTGSDLPLAFARVHPAHGKLVTLRVLNIPSRARNRIIFSTATKNFGYKFPKTRRLIISLINLIIFKNFYHKILLFRYKKLLCCVPIRAFNTRFRYASTPEGLRRRNNQTRWLVLQKARSHSHIALRAMRIFNFQFTIFNQFLNSLISNYTY